MQAFPGWINPASLQRGFTLVEVLVALAIMAVMAALTWRGIDGMVRAQEATRRYSDDVLALQAGLTQWRADLDALMSWPRENGAMPSGAAGRRSLAWNGSVLRITRMLTDTPAAGLRVVAWTRRGSDGQWLRWQSLPVLSQTAWIAAWNEAARWAQGAEQGALPGGAQAVAVAGLQDWQLLYFRNNAWTNPLSSGAEGVDNTNALPDGVRLTITLAPGQSLTGPMQIDWVRPDFGGAQ
ncbi:MAG: prepilin-type N-terminal cleavage/methylation domain-containing protein [Desulfovibrionaceae bacterium]|nr:prepilin-type N-terminal cleavage/methylation domain-containing protein [Desulfovibrionaceae bacterium]